MRRENLGQVRSRALQDALLKPIALSTSTRSCATVLILPRLEVNSCSVRYRSSKFHAELRPRLTVGRDIATVMRVPFHVYNAFTSRESVGPSQGKGNPAAVVNFEYLLEFVTNKEKGGDPFYSNDGLLQEIAAELNYSETAFVREVKDLVRGDLVPNKCYYEIRYFTPTQEIEFCGHASCAAADYVVWKRLLKGDTGDQLIFLYKNGQEELPVKFGLENGDRMYSLEASVSKPFPLPDEEQSEISDKVRDAFGCGNSKQFTVARNSIGDTFILINAVDDAVFESYYNTYMQPKHVPDMNRLAEIGGRGVCVCLTPPFWSPHASRTHPFDFYSRWFGPNVGIPEDPVTGSSCCGIAPALLAADLADRRPPRMLKGFQCSARGGAMFTTMLSNQTCVIKGAVEWDASATLEKSARAAEAVRVRCHETDTSRTR